MPFIPLLASSPLSPFSGTELSVEIALMQQGQATGANGWAPLGIFSIATATIADSGADFELTLDLYDRSWQFSQWQLLQNYTVPASTGTLEAEVVALLSYIWNNNGPGRAIAGSQPLPSWITSPNFLGVVGTPWVCPAGTYQQGQDPWQACIDMANSAGFELFFDMNGILTGKPSPGSAASGTTLSQLPV
ncbi:MAG TPA: hypothetical protein VNF75_09550, partial [Candidatus Dormibacteraeota bacterium]|nr:hypothetical protein [Candidatus Dormibacteraeota bacterium]